MARSADSVDDMARMLVTRLEAMSRTHDLLTGGAWTDLSLRRLLHSEFAPYAEADTDRLTITGDDLILTPDEALAIAMAVHELVTNSVKHGAMSKASGTIDVQLEPGTESAPARLIWRETGDFYEPDDDRRPGFGSFLLERAVAAQLGGTSRLEFSKGRMNFELQFRHGPDAETDSGNRND
jgi:two-component sensor histidine kinase